MSGPRFAVDCTDGRLTPGEIAPNAAAGPETLYQDVRLGTAQTSGGLTFDWPSDAPGFAPESSPALDQGAIRNPLGGTPVISNGLYRLTAPAASDAFFRLRR